MRVIRFVRALALLLLLGVFGFVVGCGSGPDQSALANQDESGQDATKKGLRTFHKQLRESAKANSTDRKSGRSRAKSGS